MTTEKQIKANKENVKHRRIKTSNERAVIVKIDDKKLTTEKVKDILNKVAYLDSNPTEILQKLSEELLPKIIAGKSTKEINEKTNKTFYKALMVYGLDTHYPIAETVSEKYRGLVVEFCHQLTQEYDCKTPSERALVQVIVNAYARMLEYSQELHNCRKIEYLSNEKNGFYSMLSKELDRANRQFVTALTTLKQLKTPSFEINVKTKAAFVAKNQQLNINPPNKNNPNKNENIEPK